MSDKNADAVRTLADAIASGDTDRVLDHVHPQAEAETLRSAVQGAYHGHDGMREFMRDNERIFERFEINYDNVEQLPDERVIAVGTICIRGKGSGVETRVPTAAVAEFRDGLLWRYKDYGDADAARAALG